MASGFSADVCRLCVVQEHAGNDPHAQLVPAYLGGWNKEAAYTAPPVVGPTASALLADPKHALSSGAFVHMQS